MGDRRLGTVASLLFLMQCNASVDIFDSLACGQVSQCSFEQEFLARKVALVRVSSVLQEFAIDEYESVGCRK